MRYFPRVSPRAVRPSVVRTAAALALSAGLCTPAHAVWNPITGIKTGSDTASEASLLWIGPQLWALGGVLNFLNSASVADSIYLQQQSGWSNPTVNVAGALDANLSTFELYDGATLAVNGAAPGTVTTDLAFVFGGSQATIGSMVVHQGAQLSGMASRLHLRGAYTQDGGGFDIEGASAFEADGIFNFHGDQFNVRGGAGFTVGTPGGSVTAASVDINLGSTVEIGSLAVSGSLGVFNAGTLLRVGGDFLQTGGSFNLDGA